VFRISPGGELTTLQDFGDAGQGQHRSAAS
jgi:hypothetical protein